MTDQTYVQPVNPCTRGESFCGQHGYDCPSPAVPAGQAPATDRAAGVAEAIRTFPFDNFGMDDVSFALEDAPEAQEWVPALADAVLSVLPAPADRAAVLREAADRLAAQADATWAPERTAHTVMHADAAELRRMADEAQQPETQAETCAHCGKTILRITGTLTAWWVHDPGGHTMCDPQQAASSPRATPKPAVEAQQPKEA